MLKKLYIDRIYTLKKEIKDAEVFYTKRASIIEDYLLIINNLKDSMTIITNNEKIEPNIKYIQLNEKASEIEKVFTKIGELTNENINKVANINKSKSILIQNCMEDHTNMTEKEILLEINTLLSK